MTNPVDWHSLLLDKSTISEELEIVTLCNGNLMAMVGAHPIK